MATILIVDDQPHMKELFSGELIDEGHQVEWVGDAESARKFLDSTPPDLVLLDTGDNCRKRAGSRGAGCEEEWIERPRHSSENPGLIQGHPCYSVHLIRRL